ncbi:RecX family transcriptional regulator [Oscillochloris sp. ZM17-4]|uniref:regulatory protein RecX n=1 Tax=Oscillochloris sp. ZM17-4 TaxID=2866714 RepID=UPI001C735A62|nr:RecX family transcriptional regulator [Oscillochloris sp. ZM17-4]MBX0327831.1 RecX family transcriptional regulator [Oscillochloris sp. ZM17-4]
MPTGTITALRAQANSSQRVNVFLDGEFAIGVSLNTLAREGLAVGLLIDDETWARIEATEQADRALQAGMRLIEVRPRSIAELRQRLRRKELPPPAIDYAIARLSEIGLLDDAAFSQQWVDNRRAFRPRGSLALRDELRRKGVPRALIDAALAVDEDDAGEAAEQERQRARDLARRALGRYATSPDRFTFQRKLGSYLQRRGFTFEIIRPILDDLWAELRDAADVRDEGEV